MTVAQNVSSAVSGINNFGEDLAMMLGDTPGPFWQVMWRFVSPGLIFVRARDPHSFKF